MQSYESDFIEFAIDCEALAFGQFTLKSGRVSPYFFNTGRFNSGGRLARLGEFYARAITAEGPEFDMIYGPAYKGIPLAASIAIAMWQLYERDIPYAFNRKESKDHGEGGVIVGAALEGRVLIVDDVISAGTSVRESVELIEASGARPAAVAISLDRQERGTGDRSAIDEVEQDMGIAVCSVTRLDSLIRFLADAATAGPLASHLDPVKAYRSRYGTRSST